MMEKETTEADIINFMNKWNLYRDGLELKAVRQLRGYKYTRLINVSSGKTEMFIRNNTGDIYKAASNIARAQKIRGKISNAQIFAPGGLLADGNVRHFTRGRKPGKVFAIYVEGVENTIEVEVDPTEVIL